MAQKKNYELFISYAEADKAWVEGFLLDSLQEAEINFTCESAFALGVPRISEFERAIRQSQATLLVISEAYLADGLTGFIDILAQSYGEQIGTWPVIPLTLQTGLQLSPRLKMLTGLDASNTEKQKDAVERLCDRFKRPLPTITVRPTCPYPGMISFSENDAERFFGRDEEIEELLGKLRLNSFLAVIGASGSGKSSLVFAGLIPQLKQSGLFGAGQWCIRSLRPGTNPLTNLQAVLAGDITALEVTIEQLLSTQPDTRRLLLVVDQLEELFTQANAEAIAFQQTLLRLSEMDNVYLILTVRADFYPDLMGSLLWSKIRSRLFNVLPLGEKGLRQAIIRPAEKVEVYVDPVLIERLVVDAKGEPGVLPLIQETLVLLWEKLERRFLPLKAYDELSVLPRSVYGGTETQPRTGLQVAIALRADAALADLDEAQQAIACRIFLRLIQFGEGRPDTRRQQLEADLRSFEEDEELFDATLQHLASGDRRLLTFSREENDRNRRVDIAHEALIFGWDKLQQWIDRLRKAEQTRRRLQSKAQEWTRLEQKGGLLDEAELPEAQSWLASNEAKVLGYDKSLQDLITASREKIEAAEREQKEQEQQKLRLIEDNLEAEKRAKQKAQTLNWVAGIFTILLSGATVFAFYQTRQAVLSNVDALITSAESLQDSGSGLEAIDKNIEAGIILFKKPLSRLLLLNETTIANQKLRVLTNLNQLIYGFRVRRSLTGHTDTILGLNFGLDNDKLVSTSADGSIKVWNLDNNQRQTINPQDKQIYDAILGNNGNSFISLHEQNIIHAWNLQHDCFKRSDKPLVLEEENTVFNIALSPNNETIASDKVNRINLWNAEGNPKASLNGHSDRINELNFSPNSGFLVSLGANQDNSIKVWDINNSELHKSFPQQDAVFTSVKFIDDTKVAFSDSEGKITVWNFFNKQDTKVLEDKEERNEKINTIAIASEHRFIASGGEDGSLKIWDLDNNRHLNTHRGHSTAIKKVAFNKNGQLLASADDKGNIKIWTEISPKIIDGQKFDFSSNNDKIVAGDLDGNIKLFDRELQDRDSTKTLDNSNNRNRVFNLKFSPNGKSIVSTSSFKDKSGREQDILEVWNSQGDRQGFFVTQNQIKSISFSYNYQSFATAFSQKQKVVIWDLKSLKNLDSFSTKGLIKSVDFNPNGKSIATLTDREIELRILASLQENVIRLQTPDRTEMVVMTFSPDGEFLAAADKSGKVYVWNLDRISDSSNPYIFKKIQANNYVNNINFSPGGESVILAYDDKVAVVLFEFTNNLANINNSDFRILELPKESIFRREVVQKSNSKISNTTAPNYETEQVGFSPDGKVLAASNRNNTIIWNFDFDKLLKVYKADKKSYPKEIAEVCNNNLNNYVYK